MKVLVLGQGGREHALVRALSLSASVTEIHVIPGSPAMATIALCHNISAIDQESVLSYCLNQDIQLVVIGPEDPLVLGMADCLRERGFLVVGPSKEAAQLEGSKVFAKQFMSEAGVSTSEFQVVTSVDECIKAAAQFTAPYVLKADGLAAGKGVFICGSLDELKSAAENLFDKKTLGQAGGRALLEKFEQGYEISYLVLTNGSDFESLPLAQDHKRLQDNDCGPNTGGMGAVAPVQIPEALNALIQNQVIKPTINLLRSKGMVYRGVLYFGLMITPHGPSVLEFNCRFGDPEAQVILPLLDGDWGDVFLSLSKGKLKKLKWKSIAACCVVMAAEGYPNSVKKGAKILGDFFQATNSSYFICSGVAKSEQGQWITSGGRVMAAVGLGSSMPEARDVAYKQLATVSWDGMQYRKDIGQKILNSGGLT